MGDWILNLPVLWMAVVVLAAIYVVTAGIYLLVTALAVQERARAFPRRFHRACGPALRHIRAAGWISGSAGLERCRSGAWGPEPRSECPACGSDSRWGVSMRDRGAHLRDLVRGHIQDAVNRSGQP